MLRPKSGSKVASNYHSEHTRHLLDGLQQRYTCDWLFWVLDDSILCVMKGARGILGPQTVCLEALYAVNLYSHQDLLSLIR